MERNNKAIRVNGGSKGHRKTYYIDDYGTNKNYRDFDREPRDKEPLYSKAYKALAELDMLKGSGMLKTFLLLMRDCKNVRIFKRADLGFTDQTFTSAINT